MVVATTTFPVRIPRCLKIPRRHQQNRISVDHVAMCVRQHATVGIAIERQSELRPALLHLGRDPFRMQSSATVIDVAAVWASHSAA